MDELLTKRKELLKVLEWFISVADNPEVSTIDDLVELLRSQLEDVSIQIRDLKNGVVL